MRGGVIVERGTPQDIYLRSNNPFVVDFIGRANFLDATIKGYQDERHAIVSCALGDIVCNAPSDLGIGTDVTIYTRPESFEVVPPSSPPIENEFEGTVTSLLFAGEAHEAEISVGGAVYLQSSSSIFRSRRATRCDCISTVNGAAPLTRQRRHDSA